MTTAMMLIKIMMLMTMMKNFRFECTSSIVTNSFQFKSNPTITRIYLYAQIVFNDVRNQMYQWLKLYSCLPHIIHVYRCAHLLLQIPSIAQCVLCKVYFSAQPNKLGPILKFKKYYPIEHIFVPACSSARKIHFFKF